MGGESSPAHDARQAKLVEGPGIVCRDAARQDLRLPGVGGRFEPLELSNYLVRAAFARHLSSWLEVLPAQ